MTRDPANRRRRARAAALAVGMALAAGCASYRLGTTLPPGVRSIYVRTFENKTREPRLEFETTNKALEEFRRDGTLKVTTEAEADILLETRLTDYRIEPVRYRRDERSTPDEYRIVIVADVTVRRAQTGEVMASQAGLRGDHTFVVTGGLKAAERAALPLAARDLARAIVEFVVEYW